MRDRGLEFQSNDVIWTNTALFVRVPESDRRNTPLEKGTLELIEGGEHIAIGFKEVSKPRVYLKTVRRVPAFITEQDFIEENEGIVLKARRVKMYSQREQDVVPTNTMELELSEQRVYLEVGGRDYQLEDRTRPPTQCFRCQGWGHMAYRCRKAQESCRLCSKDHATKECPMKLNKGGPWQPKCINCGEDHISTSIKCKIRQAYITKLVFGGRQAAGSEATFTPGKASSPKRASVPVQAAGPSRPPEVNAGQIKSYVKVVSKDSILDDENDETRNQGNRGARVHFHQALTRFERAQSLDDRLEIMVEMMFNMFQGQLALENRIARMNKNHQDV